MPFHQLLQSLKLYQTKLTEGFRCRATLNEYQSAILLLITSMSYLQLHSSCRVRQLKPRYVNVLGYLHRRLDLYEISLVCIRSACL